MADEEGGSAEVSENNAKKPHENGSDAIESTEISGWLMKRTKVTHKWVKEWFHLKNTSLLYGKSAEDTPKEISLVGVEIAQSNIDNKENAFRVKPKTSKRIYYLQAENESDLHNWMQAICFAKASGRTGGESEACVIQ